MIESFSLLSQEEDEIEEVGSIPRVTPPIQQQQSLMATTMMPTSLPPPVPLLPQPQLQQHIVTPVTAAAATLASPATPHHDVTGEDRSKLSPTSMLPTLKYIDDPSLFDLDALTCHACNKSFKNTRAFKLHRDRHQVRKMFFL